MNGSIAFLFLGMAIGAAAGAIWGVLRTEVKYQLEILNLNAYIRRMVVKAQAIEALLKERQIEIHVVENGMSIQDETKITKH